MYIYTYTYTVIHIHIHIHVCVHLAMLDTIKEDSRFPRDHSGCQERMELSLTYPPPFYAFLYVLLPNQKDGRVNATRKANSQ